VQIIFHRDLGLKCLKRRLLVVVAGQLIETNRHARLFCSKQLLNAVISIRFSVKKLY